MDKIWDRKSFEVGGNWPLWRRWKKRMTTQNRHNSNAKKQKISISMIMVLLKQTYLLIHYEAHHRVRVSRMGLTADILFILVNYSVLIRNVNTRHSLQS